MANPPVKWKPSLSDIMITLVILSMTTAVCIILSDLGDSDIFVPLLYVLAVLIVARTTDSYTCSITAAVIAVLGVNYVFTYPYMEFNFSISGYPLTFVVMLAVAISTSTLTIHIKQQQLINFENEREKVRANLMRAISHDLRTPLTSIIGSLGAVVDRDELSDDKKRELLLEARSDAQWLLRMVENLLSVTRVESKEAQIAKTPEAAEEVVSETVTKFKKNFPNIHISVSVPTDVLFVPMDAMLIEQVMANLLENAVIHGENTKNIQLVVTKTEKEAIFSVADDGCGIAPDALPRLFTDYFDRTKNLYYREKRNMGIGLSVCQTIINSHGGKISASNLADAGAQFTFTLPLE